MAQSVVHVSFFNGSVGVIKRRRLDRLMVDILSAQLAYTSPCSSSSSRLTLKLKKQMQYCVECGPS
ncbi:hypothetical protein HanXRQr2_Chr17g0799831 [Helianthus annuus]|uniref:Uncharacterized protein n=1 Tax=Helianthus annuus TaxID=4232 RepID=A0A9K3GTJ3_HELAN|nr:hypothetical protein HanXRQr2_Chr17g0799831 [Helianthus annuus]KAJ0812917.1 hypothetical protein HanPSC8_Chr17g0767421 [Helianthus annuus]